VQRHPSAAALVAGRARWSAGGPAAARGRADHLAHGAGRLDHLKTPASRRLSIPRFRPPAAGRIPPSITRDVTDCATEVVLVVLRGRSSPLRPDKRERRGAA